MLVLLNATINDSVVVLFKIMMGVILYIMLIRIFVQLNNKLIKNGKSRKIN
jgi:hypothetical protein